MPGALWRGEKNTTMYAAEESAGMTRVGGDTAVCSERMRTVKIFRYSSLRNSGEDLSLSLCVLCAEKHVRA